MNVQPALTVKTRLNPIIDTTDRLQPLVPLEEGADNLHTGDTAIIGNTPSIGSAVIIAITGFNLNTVPTGTFDSIVILRKNPFSYTTFVTFVKRNTIGTDAINARLLTGATTPRTDKIVIVPTTLTIVVNHITDKEGPAATTASIVIVDTIGTIVFVVENAYTAFQYTFATSGTKRRILF